MPTNKLKLPYILTAQSQKEVTHNHALERLDMYVTPVVKTIISSPPPTPITGDTHLISSSPEEGIFTTHKNQLAKASEGGWQFYAPFTWMDIWIESSGDRLLYDGKKWVPFALLRKPSGETLLLQHQEEMLSLHSSSLNTTMKLPDRSLVIAVNIRVKETIEGVPAFHVGIENDITRYGNSIGVTKDTTNIGMSYHPITYYADTPLVVTAKKNTFTAGILHITTQYFQPHGPWDW